MSPYFRLNNQPWINSRTQYRDLGRPGTRTTRRKSRPRKRPPAAVPVPTFEQVTDPEYLILIYDILAQYGGQAPGPDGVRYPNLGRREICAAMRGLSRLVRTGKWNNIPRRRVHIPKPVGYRTLSISSIYQRVLDRAMTESLTPVIAPTLNPSSFGRSAGGHLRLLAALQQTVQSDERFVLAQDDITDAFPSVRLADVIQSLQEQVPCPRLQRLIHIVLTGHYRSGQSNTTVGIDQGSALSPLALEVVLRDHHDRPMSHAGNPSWSRYVDNLTYLCHDVDEGNRVLEQASALLSPAGFSLKGLGAPVDLRDTMGGAGPQVLGFQLSHHNDQLQFGLGKDSWNKLKQNLDGAHGQPNPAQAAKQVIAGWIAAMGPALSNAADAAIPDRVRHTAAKCGFRETGSTGELHYWCSQAQDAWCALQREAQTRHNQRHAATANGSGVSAERSARSTSSERNSNECVATVPDAEGSPSGTAPF